MGWAAISLPSWQQMKKVLGAPTAAWAKQPGREAGLQKGWNCGWQISNPGGMLCDDTTNPITLCFQITIYIPLNQVIIHFLFVCDVFLFRSLRMRLKYEELLGIYIVNLPVQFLLLRASNFSR